MYHVNLALLILALLIPILGLAETARAAPIKLGSITFNPRLGEVPAIPADLAITGYPAHQRGYYIVQFKGPIEQAWKDKLTEIGAELLSYLPEFAFKVRMTPEQASKAKRLDSVAWVGLFQPAFKLSPKLIRDGTHLYTIRIERGGDVSKSATDIAKIGANILAQQGNILRVAVDSRQLNAIAKVLDVAWIENFLFKEKHNEYGGGIIMNANTAHANNYNGSTQIVAIADTGLGDGTASGAHVDIPPGRITAIYDWPASDAFLCYNAIPDGPQDVDSGHGTHVALSAVGDGGFYGEAKGVAPSANLIFQAVEDYLDFYGLCFANPDGYYLAGIPDDIRQLFQQAYNAGARIHSDSWGSNAQGAYTVDSANADDFIWNHPQMTITFSVGNEGVDANHDGIVDGGSIGSPATAKNVISVGASENDRQSHYECDESLDYTSCSAQGGQNNIFTYGEAWPSDFPSEPLKSDPTAGNDGQMAAFSSRGPTEDGRIKPDVVAPGTWVLSGYSDMYQQGYDPSPNPQNNAWQYDGWGFPLSQDYKYMGGTSMSNPLVAGAAAVVRDFYAKNYGHSASAALVKATLINSAVDMLDENNDGANDNDYPIPNRHEGWGLVNLANATDGNRKFIDEATGLNTNSSITYEFNIVSSNKPLKFTLVWSDYPSSENASKNLVNDLDLEVTSPDGELYLGNAFSGGWSQTGGSPDRTNNVENVYIQSPQGGTWKAKVSGYNVPFGPQPYALVVAGAFGAIDKPPAVNIINPPEGSTVSGTVKIQIEATDDEDADGTLTVDWNVDGGPWQTATYNAATGYYEADWDTTSASDGNHTLNARAKDSANHETTDSHTVIVDNTPETMHVGDLDGSSTLFFFWWRASVMITVHNSIHEPVASAEVSGTWSGGFSGSVSCTTNSNGQCSVISNWMSNQQSSTTFTVDNITHASLAYQPSANHDPDGDSDGTRITVRRR